MYNSFYFVLLFIPYFFIMYYSCWKTYRDCSKVLVIIAFIGWIAGIVWIGAFFGIFYENLNFDYKPAYNCTI